MSGATSATLGIAGLLIGGVLLAGALSISASAGQPTWRGSGRGGRCSWAW